MGTVRGELAGIGVLVAQHIAGKFNDHDLHTKADAKAGHMVLAGILGGLDHALDAAVAKAAGHDDAVHVCKSFLAGSLIGQEITVAVTDPDTGAANGVKYGKVISVDFTQGDPVVRLEGDDTSYKMSSVLGVGKLPEKAGEKDPDRGSEKTDKITEQLANADLKDTGSEDTETEEM